METEVRGEELNQHSESWKSTRDLKTYTKLNLGCGNDIKEGYVNVDTRPEIHPDIVANLFEFPWPLETDKYNEVYISHFVEHVPNLIPFMDELWRVCAPFAQVEIRGPYINTTGAAQDPTHYRGLCTQLFHYFSKIGRENMGVGHYPIKANFHVEKSEMTLHDDFQFLPQQHKEWALDHYVNVVQEIKVWLTAVKR